jgi:putative FmdB family regulatory protein
MPLYEFTCDECEHSFETLVRREVDIPSVACPKCNGTRVKREISVPARPLSASPTLPSSCGEGPPCGAPWCGRKQT